MRLWVRARRDPFRGSHHSICHSCEEKPAVIRRSKKEINGSDNSRVWQQFNRKIYWSCFVSKGRGCPHLSALAPTYKTYGSHKRKRRNTQQLWRQEEMMWEREIILSEDIFLSGDVNWRLAFTSAPCPLTSLARKKLVLGNWGEGGLSSMGQSWDQLAGFEHWL